MCAMKESSYDLGPHLLDFQDLPHIDQYLFWNLKNDKGAQIFD